MRSIRIGNDIALEWKISRNGVPEDFRGKSLSLFICHRYGREKVSSFSIEGNKLRFAFLGKNQRYVGSYSLLLIVNEGIDGMFSVDLEHAFRLTQHTDCGCSQEIKLASDIAVPANGLSAYELAVINGYDGTEKEWLESINKPSVDAATKAITVATKATEAATKAEEVAAGLDTKLATKQDKTDATLQTKDKTITGAINELATTQKEVEQSITSLETFAGGGQP